MGEKLELEELSKIYKELREDAVKFAEDAISFAKGVAKKARNFKYFCVTLAIYSGVFMALGLYFLRLPENFAVALSLLTICGINIIYAVLLWRDYLETVKEYKGLIDAEKELREIKKRLQETSTSGAGS